ncbi:hypothetical protein PsYK624_058160 [Phanerochaete sordida]|uniref:Uncharacterized protein n=1 Tax=Phanerochaete sordida TaxID=48140 RepID=A0A9P3LBZ2_9APHY|nr:hypothetical protein PsYK624_058160 [Phanerochaete sordida]
MADKQIKALEKVMAEEVKIDLQQIKRVQKELKAVEKLYKASVKETAKAEKALEKAGKSKIKAEQGLQKAQKQHNNASSDLDKAERHVEEMDKRANLEAQDVQQRHGQVSERFGEFHEHERSRMQQRSEMTLASGGGVAEPQAA